MTSIKDNRVLILIKTIMSYTQQAIGLLGGTFDPIHFGHLRLALELCNACELATVYITPCYRPVHRSLPLASPEQRLAMVKLATDTEPTLLSDDREIRQKKHSYCIHTLLALRSAFPMTPLCLLMGSDTFLGLASWHRWEEIVTMAHLLVAHRPLYQLPTQGVLADLLHTKQQQNPLSLHEQLAGNIYLHSITALEISATTIRQQIATGGNPRYLLPETVYSYIKQNKLYQMR